MAQEITTIPEKYEFGSTDMDSNLAENPSSPYRARRHSLSENPGTTKHRVPIHLRASTGSCHDLCKFGKKHYSEEKTKEPFRKRISKSLPNEPISSKMIVSEPSRATASRSSPKESKHVKTTTSGVQNTKNSSPLVNISPRQSALSGNKTRSLNLLCSVSEQPPEILKREILLTPSEKVEALVEEGSSNDNKMLRADKKMFDQTVNHSSSEKAKLIKTNKPLIASGRKTKSSVTSADKASESPTARLSSKLYLGKTMSSRTREKVGKEKLSLSSSVKHRNGTEKSNNEVSERTLHVIKTETEKNMLNPEVRKNGVVKPSSPPSLATGIHVIKTESESNASTSALSPLSSSCVKSLSLSSLEEKDEYEEIQDTISIKTKENHARAKSLSSSSHEDDDGEMIDQSNSEAGELIEDKTVSSESKNHDTNPTLSSSRKDDDDLTIDHTNNEAGELIEDKIVSSEIKYHDTNPTLSSSRKNDDNKMIDHSNNEAGELIEDKIVSSEIKNHDTNPTSSSSHKEEEEEEEEEEEKEEEEEEEEEEEIYPSSSESSSHTRSSSLSSLEENDDEINGELVSDKMISTDIGKSQFPKEIQTSLRKSRSIRSNDKNNSSPVKLKFRRGKIIDLQPENNVPKRLKFRRARNSDNYNKMDHFAPEGMKSIIMEMGNVKPETPPNRTLRKVDSCISDKKTSTDVKPETPNRSLRKSRSVTSEDKDRTPVSLIHREKTVDPQASNNSPTRLKFTRGRALSVEDAKSDPWRKSIKKVGGNTDAVGSEASSRDVVLKHPEVQRKNNGQVLLNNVIEETACKLVESRKSKVKALVGAFETVISLHETKPAASSHAVG